MLIFLSAIIIIGLLLLVSILLFAKTELFVKIATEYRFNIYCKMSFILFFVFTHCNDCDVDSMQRLVTIKQIFICMFFGHTSMFIGHTLTHVWDFSLFAAEKLPFDFVG